MLRVLILAALAAGCAQPGVSPSPGVPEPTSSPLITPDLGIPTIPEGELPTMDASPIDDPAVAQVAEQAKSQLADRLRVEPSAVEVLHAERVTWPDTALGCPEPGQFYAQVLVEGFRVVLSADSRVWLYHAGSEGEPFVCPSDEHDGGYDFVPPPRFDE